MVEGQSDEVLFNGGISCVLTMYGAKTALHCKNELRYKCFITLASKDKIKITQPAVPKNVLKIIFCSCKIGCGSACGCRKVGFYCSPACILYSGSDCNIHPPLEEDESLKRKILMKIKYNLFCIYVSKAKNF
ncbi:hypothetical protein RN001_010053 [Aquatica leii]|uniref:Uncharacterized protein n=1 Tax=Aquatica leii TaxID=1421715 RepID=A0AAN7SE81_9COLE|nr:hypothetical protein RN001_010053 [Aquatica leii]